jgi:hypothetical protein
VTITKMCQMISYMSTLLTKGADQVTDPILRDLMLEAVEEAKGVEEEVSKDIELRIRQMEILEELAESFL